jgi:sec-independent protein translocase protein TatA
MGAGGIGIWQLAIILVIVLLLFGTKRLRNLGGDLGNAFKGFKNAISDDDKTNPTSVPIDNIANQNASTESTASEPKKTESL